VVLGQQSIKQQLTDIYHSPEELQADLIHLFERIEAIHIDPYTVTSKVEIENQIEEARSHLTKPMNSLEFWKIVNPIVVNLFDGHTGLGITDKSIFLADSYFPFDVEFDDTKNFIIVKKKFGNNIDLLPGDKILSINGKSSQQIINDLIQNISGEMISFRIAVAQLAFSPFLYWLYDFEKGFEIVFEQHGETKTSIVNPVSKEFFLSQFELTFSKGVQPYRLEIIDQLTQQLLSLIDLKKGSIFKNF